jgi:hypothetical protein
MKRSLGSIPQRSEDSEPGGKRAKRSAAGVRDVGYSAAQTVSLRFPMRTAPKPIFDKP